MPSSLMPVNSVPPIASAPEHGSSGARTAPSCSARSSSSLASAISRTASSEGRRGRRSRRGPDRLAVERLLPELGERLLERRARRDVRGRPGRGLSRRGQRAAVELAVRARREALEGHEGARHHVRGQPGTQRGAQRVRVERRAGARREIADEPPVAGVVLAPHDRRAGGRRILREHRLDLAERIEQLERGELRPGIGGERPQDPGQPSGEGGGVPRVHARRVVADRGREPLAPAQDQAQRERAAGEARALQGDRQLARPRGVPLDLGEAGREAGQPLLGCIVLPDWPGQENPPRRWRSGACPARSGGRLDLRVAARGAGGRPGYADRGARAGAPEYIAIRSSRARHSRVDRAGRAVADRRGPPCS